MSNTICIDAGPVIHLVAFPEKESVQQSWESWEENGITITAPVLLYFEVTNILYRYHKFGVLSDKGLFTALTAALALPIDLVEDPELHFRAAEIASLYNLSATYDAQYLALAERFESELWTTDEKLFNQIQLSGKIAVRLLPS